MERYSSMREKLQRALKAVRGSQKQRQGRRRIGKRGKASSAAPCRLSPKESNELVRSIGEAAHNVLRGNVPLSEERRRRLVGPKSCHREHLHCLAKKSVSLKAKKKILNQRGGALLPLLIPPVLTFLAKIAADKIINRK